MVPPFNEPLHDLACLLLLLQLDDEDLDFGFDIVAVYVLDEARGTTTRVAGEGYQTKLGRELEPFRTTPVVAAVATSAPT